MALQVVIGANVDQATAGINKVEADLNRLPQSINKADAALKNLSKSSSSATQATINLGRVIQDAPFGFIGIANNINPLLESFQRLKAESGSTGQAIKALAGSFIGAGGLGLAVSIVSSLLLVFSLNSRGAKEKTEEHKQAVDESAEKQKEFESALNSASKSVISQAKDLTELKEILLGTTSVSDGLTKSIINQGLARYLFDQKNSELQKILSAEIEKQIILKKRLVGVSGVSEFKIDPALEGLKRFQQSMEKLGTRAPGNLPADIKRIEELNDVIGNSGGSVALLDSLGRGFEDFYKKFIGKSDLKVKPYLDPYDFIKGIEDFNNSNRIAIKVNVIPNLNNEDKTNGFYNEIKDKRIDLSVPINLIPTIPKPALTDFEKDTQKAVENINSIIEQVQVDSLANIGDAIGTALSGGDLGKVFAEFGNIIGSGLQAIGKQIISIGVAALLAKEALKKLFTNPAIAIAAGIGLIAAGAALKSVLSKGVPGRAAGGAVSAGQLYEVGERGRELFRPSTSGRIIPAHQTGLQGSAVPIINFNGEFAISGNMLKLLLSRTDRYQGRNV